ncbi:hypothetical protein AB0E52_09130 [Micrococcus luteus]|uniref:hypothetical protein n=1 Tax=Micrococcaceae TaxID=1268 RepID=UPI00331663E2
MTETGRFYSSIRRIPTTLYRLPDGTRLPGGPYTLVQGVAGAATIAVLWAIRGAWSTGTLLIDAVAVLAAGMGVIMLTRFAPDNIHELVMVVTGAFKAAAKPSAGRYADQSWQLPRPPRGMTPRSGSPSATTHAGPSAASTAPVAPTFRPLGTSSVTRLLQQSADQTKDTAA